MDAEQKIVTPLYHLIAIDLATKIVNGIYKPGERIRGRSTLAGHYNVSPETIRRAMFILQDMGIVSVVPSVGIQVLSTEKALEFIETFRDIQTLTRQKNEIAELLSKSAALNNQIYESVKSLVEQTENYRALNPFMPYEIVVEQRDSVVGKTISELNFWHSTGVTIIAIKRGEITIISPGPHHEFVVGDILMIVGDEESFRRAVKFIKNSSAGGA